MINRRFKLPLAYWRWLRLPARSCLGAVVGRAPQRGRRLHRGGSSSSLRADPRLYEEPKNFLQSMIVAQETGERIQRRGDRRQHAHPAHRRRGHDCAHDGLDGLAARAQPRGTGALRGRGGKRALGRAASSSASTRQVERLSYGEAAFERVDPTTFGHSLRPGFEPLADVTIADTRIPAGTPLMVMFRPRRPARKQRGPRPRVRPRALARTRSTRSPRSEVLPRLRRRPALLPGAKPGLPRGEGRGWLPMIARNFKLGDRRE